MRRFTRVPLRPRDRPPGRPGMPRAAGVLAAAQFAASVAVSPARAEVSPRTMNGVPLLPIPTFEEIGLPAFTMPTGTPSTGADASGGGGGETGGGGTSTAALEEMRSQSWGIAAAANAEALGVDPAAVAGTGLIESNFRNVAASGGGTVSGVFQMTDRTYTADMQAVLREHPELAGRIDTSLAGKMDPANQAYAAAQELKTNALRLRAVGIEAPTLAQVRGGYNFGQGNTVTLAQAGDDQLMADVLVGTSTATMRANGVTPATTVGQWRASVEAKLGGAGGVRVLTNRT